MMLSPSNPYTPSLQMQQNIYVLDPVPSQPPQILPAQQMIYMPADQGAHPAYLYKYINSTFYRINFIIEKIIYFKLFECKKYLKVAF